MRQDEPQAMTFIEVLLVHVDPHINKHRKSESERKRKNKATRKMKKLGNTKQTKYVSSVYQDLFILISLLKSLILSLLCIAHK